MGNGAGKIHPAPGRGDLANGHRAERKHRHQSEDPPKNLNNYRITDTALGTIRSLEATVQGFEERVERLELDITDANKRVKELGEKVGAKFEREDRFQELTSRQSEIEEKLDLTKNQASSQVDD